ncbi:hypothetical protein DFJ58DRAFT_912450 [Suillus subalutaceus]|uniref:uncharacterized protein n=1 Tax=Suillus subalutaceus TaxID=48586 RepID=UPI001B85EC0F|nr:uncharacterized protein DFJ58DRAFT_912450 [Suillus subalutaceus]KAG1862738.1 hypothetical protein DFJ58DRAFT_912450 [Suillus subalutaceus]
MELAICLRDRILSSRASWMDLNEAIELQRAALALYPPAIDRFQQRGIPSDLEEAIELHRVALELRPTGHSERSSSFNNLANSLRDRFQQWGTLPDLEEAIQFHRAALALCPPSHSDRSMFLNNLAISLRVRLEQRGILSDLEEVIQTGPHLSTTLPTAFGTDFENWGVLADLDEAIKLYRAALALFLQISFSGEGVVSALDEAIELHRAALALRPWVIQTDPLPSTTSVSAFKIDSSSGVSCLTWTRLLSSIGLHWSFVLPIMLTDPGILATLPLACETVSRGDLHAAKTWAAFAEELQHGSALVAYQTVLKFLDQHLAILSSSSRLFDVVREATSSLAIDAFSCSIRHGALMTAVELFPQVQQLTMQWDDVVSRIRTVLSDFSQFLLPPLFSDLRRAAENGPVIFSQDPVHVPLDIGRTEVSELSSEFQSLAERVGSSHHQLELPKIVGILRKLWFRIDPTRGKVIICLILLYILLHPNLVGTHPRKTAGQPGQGKGLRCVAPELAVVAERVAPIASFTPLADSDATVQGALDALDRNQWLHLACHGVPNRQQPFESSFAMRDGPLMIKDIIRSHWRDPEFAFLSACHTTVGNAVLRIRSVIGSMWSVDDEVARQVVSAFYDNLVDGSGSFLRLVRHILGVFSMNDFYGYLDIGVYSTHSQFVSSRSRLHSKPNATEVEVDGPST